MNPIALQLGHLIASERMIVEMVTPGVSPPLPAGFAEKHDLKKPSTDDIALLDQGRIHQALGCPAGRDQDGPRRT